MKPSSGRLPTPGRYVGAEAAEDDGETFEEKMQRLVALLQEKTNEGVRLDEQIKLNLGGLVCFLEVER